MGNAQHMALLERRALLAKQLVLGQALQMLAQEQKATVNRGTYTVLLGTVDAVHTTMLRLDVLETIDQVKGRTHKATAHNNTKKETRSRSLKVRGSVALH